MELGDRKKQILKAVVDDYIKTAEPIGSASIMKKYMQELSSATIRNEMSDLEKMGYVYQPHTSAGRVPSQEGYRFYVDQLMERYRLSAEEMIQIQNAMRNAPHGFERLVCALGDVLASLTHYISVVMTPRLGRCSIKHIELVRLDGYNLVLIVFASNEMVKHHHIKLEFSVESELVERVSHLLNREFTNMRIDQIDEQSFIRMMVVFHETIEFIAKVLKLIIQALDEMTESEIYLYGASNLFHFPEYQDVNRAQEMLHYLDDKEAIKGMLTSMEETEGICVLVGGESGLVPLKDCSVVVSRYLPRRSVTGVIGVIGPMRMDYARVIAVMEYLLRHLERVIPQSAFAAENQMIVSRRGMFLRLDQDDWWDR